MTKLLKVTFFWKRYLWIMIEFESYVWFSRLYSIWLIRDWFDSFLLFVCFRQSSSSWKKVIQKKRKKRQLIKQDGQTKFKINRSRKCVCVDDKRVSSVSQHSSSVVFSKFEQTNWNQTETRFGKQKEKTRLSFAWIQLDCFQFTSDWVYRGNWNHFGG